MIVTNRPKPGDTVNIGMGGLAHVTDGDARCGRARGIRVLRHRSGNYYLDSDGKPHEAPSRYSEFIQDGLYTPIPQPSCSQG